MLTIWNRNNFSRFGIILSSFILVNPCELSPPSCLSWFSCKYKLDLIVCSSFSYFGFAKKIQYQSKANDRTTSPERLQWVVLQFGNEFNLRSKHNLQIFKINSRLYMYIYTRTRILLFYLDLNDLDLNYVASIWDPSYVYEITLVSLSNFLKYKLLDWIDSAMYHQYTHQYLNPIWNVFPNDTLTW